MRQILVLTTAAAAVFSGGAALAPAQAMPASPMPASQLAQAAPAANAIQQVQYRRGWRGGRGYGWRHRRGFGGAGLGIGLATGAIIGGALANGAYNGAYAAPPPDDATGYCMQRFRSYDPASGTYLGFDGQRHPCP